MKERMELLTNVSLILLAGVFIGDLVHTRFMSPPPKAAAASVSIRGATRGPQVGLPVRLDGVTWDKKNTLIVAIQEGCHFCEESMPFYKKLTEEINKTGNSRLIIATPGSIDSARSYLKKHHLLGVGTVIKASFETLSVRGTPTIILVDDKGTIKQTWVGKLVEADETEVLHLIV